MHRVHDFLPLPVALNGTTEERETRWNQRDKSKWPGVCVVEKNMDHVRPPGIRPLGSGQTAAMERFRSENRMVTKDYSLILIATYTCKDQSADKYCAWHWSTCYLQWCMAGDRVTEIDVTPIYRPNGMHTLMCAQRSITHKFTNYNRSIITNVITSRYLTHSLNTNVAEV
jgi:hypothetical protein